MTASIAFTSLFLGLVSGPCAVELRASPGVASIVLSLDGRPVERLTAPPWRGRVDFGPGLLPHALGAAAFDGEGRLLSAVEQFVNVARPPAEVALLVENDARGRPHRARLVWGSLGSPHGASITLLLDGQPLPLGEDFSAALPPLGDERPHVLSAALSFGPALSARHDVALGGGLQEASGDQLTGVLVQPAGAQPAGASDREPTAETLARQILVAGQPARAVALERAAGAVFFVRSGAADAARRALRGIRRGNERTMRSLTEARLVPADNQHRRYEARLAPDDRFRFLWPIPSDAMGASLPTRLFDGSHEYGHADGGLFWFLNEVEHPNARIGAERWADAVAVAGLQALASQKRRAVVLVLGDESADRSHYEPRVVREYLESIRVPLFLWSLEHRPSALARAWGLPVVDVSSPDRLRRAAADLKNTLAAQRILWLSGLHLPNAITEANGLAATIRSQP